MPWMPADSEQTAEAVSYAVYHLTRPQATDTNTTQYAFGWRTAVDGSVWMRWDGDTVLPVHADRGDDLASILAQFVTAGQLTQASADAVLALAEAREGSTVTLSEVTPPEWTALLLTDEQAEPMWSPSGY
jgi:hypothetical protein